MVANTLLFALFVAFVSGLDDVMKHLCENPVNPACVGTYTAPDIGAPECKLRCNINVAKPEKRNFCSEQLPYLLNKVGRRPNHITCIFRSVVSCETGNYVAGKCVKHHPQRMTYAEAEAECKKENAVLETFDFKNHINWIQLSTPNSEPAIWKQSSTDENVLVVVDTKCAAAGTIIKSDDTYPKMTFFCSVVKDKDLFAHQLYCEALKKLHVAASFENGKCMVLTNSLYFGAQANAGSDLHETCTNISPFEGRAAVPFRQMESDHMKHVVAGSSYIHTIVQPATPRNDKDDPYNDWCTTKKEKTPKMYSFVTQSNGTRSTYFEIPEYTYVGQDKFPNCETGEGLLKIASVAKTKNGNVPISKAFATPTACLIAPNLNNALVGSCDPGWLAFEKYQGFIWCVKYVHHGKKTYNEGKLICANEGAVMTGFDNELEYIQLLDVATKEMGKHNIVIGAVWLGSVRKDICKDADRNSQPPCHYQEQFAWSDNVTVGGFAWTHWENNEPTNWYHQETVMTMMVYPGNPVHGLMNDLHVSWDYPSLRWTGFGSLCGKRAKIN